MQSPEVVMDRAGHLESANLEAGGRLLIRASRFEIRLRLMGRGKTKPFQIM
jgi:hypothetical protein